MPIQPGILLSSLLVITCLGMNLTLYPEVREMFRTPEGRTANPPALADRMEENSKPIYPKLEKAAPVKENTEKPEPVVKPEKESKVNRPIPVDSGKIDKKPEKKTDEKKDGEKKKVPEKKAAETPPPKAEPKKPEPEKKTEKKSGTEEKPPEKKPEPAPQKPAEEKKVDSKPAEKPVEKKTEPEKSREDESYGLPSVFPLDAAPVTKKEDEIPKKKGAAAFQPLVPSELEKDYRDSEGKKVNQIDLPSQQKPPQQTPSQQILPGLKQEPKVSEQAAPMYADPFKPSPKPEVAESVRRLPELETPPAEPPKERPPKERKPPKAVWNTVETIMERPIVYE